MSEPHSLTYLKTLRQIGDHFYIKGHKTQIIISYHKAPFMKYKFFINHKVQTVFEITAEAHLEPCQTSVMELSCKNS